jgi:hypothetical protein
MEIKWKKFKGHVKETATNILGVVKRKAKKWISEKTLKLSAMNKEISSKKSTVYKSLRQECRKLARV